MTSIRISLASLAAFNDSSSCSGCSDRNGFDSENYEFLGHLAEASSNDHGSGAVDWADCSDQEVTAVPLSDEYEIHGTSIGNPAVKTDKAADLCLRATDSQLPISIPLGGSKPTRRVSFNLRENSVLQLPSNAAIGKIASARAKRRLSLSAEVDKHLADMRAKALLPHGASPDLLDPGFAMTSLYVKRGHIHSLEQQHALGLSPGSDAVINEIGLRMGSSAPGVPVKGVLKPFAPSPVHASFYMSEQQDRLDEDEEEERKYEESVRRRKERAEKEEAEMAHENEQEHKHKHKQKPSKKSKKGGKKKCSSKEKIALPTPLPLPNPISVSSKV